MKYKTASKKIPTRVNYKRYYIKNYDKKGRPIYYDFYRNKRTTKSKAIAYAKRNNYKLSSIPAQKEYMIYYSRKRPPITGIPRNQKRVTLTIKILIENYQLADGSYQDIPLNTKIAFNYHLTSTQIRKAIKEEEERLNEQFGISGKGGPLDTRLTVKSVTISEYTLN